MKCSIMRRSYRTILALGAVAALWSCGGDGTSKVDDASGGSGGDAGSAPSGGSQAGRSGGAAGATSAGAGGTSIPSAGQGGGAAGAAGGGAGAAGAAAGTAGQAAGAAGASAGATAGAAGTSATYAPPSISFDFEKATAGQAPGAPFNGGTVDQSKAYSGKNSVRVNCPGGQDSCFFSIPIRSYIASNGKTAYARFMIYLSSMPKYGNNDHYDFARFWGKIQGGGVTLSNAYVAFGGTETARQKLHMFNPDPWEDCTETAPLLVKPGAWTCVEVNFDENDVTANYSSYVNGEVIRQFTFPYDLAASTCFSRPGNPQDNPFKGVWYLPAIDRVDFGLGKIRNSGTNPGDTTIWFDDIAFSKTRIGCPAKP